MRIKDTSSVDNKYSDIPAAAQGPAPEKPTSWGLGILRTGSRSGKKEFTGAVESVSPSFQRQLTRGFGQISQRPQVTN
jgi:hypothetical protein